MAVAILEREFVEYVFVEAHVREFEPVIGHRTRVRREVGLHKGHGRRVELGVVQADMQLAVGNDGVLVRENITALELGETQRLVKAQRLQDVAGADAELEERAYRAHRGHPDVC